MQSITLVCIGSIKQSIYKEAIEFFTKRISHHCNFTVVELPDSKQKDIAKKQAEESEAIVEYCAKFAGTSIALDESGKQYSSTELASFIKTQQDYGTPLCFIIGGAYGFTQAVQAAADHIITLSRCTFTHELCRLVFMEQLYRSFQINLQTGYHHF